MQAVLDHTIPYLHVREAFGQKIGQFQVSEIVEVSSSTGLRFYIGVRGEHCRMAIVLLLQSEPEFTGHGYFPIQPGVGGSSHCSASSYWR